MSDFDLPDLPSDEELGITAEDRDELGRETSAGANEAAGEESGSSPADGGEGRDRDGRGRGTGGPKPLAAVPPWRGPVTLLLLVGLALFSSSRTGQVRPGPANTPDTGFSSARAMSTLVEMAREAHPTGSPEHERVRNLLIERLRSLGLEPEVQMATSLLERRGFVTGDPAIARSATVRNIIARVPGTDPSGTLLITAHYDSRGIAVGAADDGSGVVTILEAVRALRAGAPPRNDVVVLLTDAEELDLLGARAFVDQHPLMPEIDLVLSFEMRGAAGPSIMFETNERNGWVVRALRDFDPHPFANSLSYEVYERMPRDTDFTPFKEAGVQGLNFAGIDNAHVYHQAYDVPENLSPSTLQHHGIHALAALRHFGSVDLTSVNASNVVFFSVPGLGLVVYDQVWVIAISIFLLIGFTLLALVARRAGARLRRVAAGALVSVGVGGLAYLLGTAVFGWLQGFHPEYGALEGSAFHSEGWYVLALVSTALVLVTGSKTLVRRWIAPVELAVGSVVVPLVGAVVVGFVAPLGAMDLQWPVAAAILSVTVMALLGTRATGIVGWIVSVALAVPVFLILQTVLELLWLAMSLELAGGLAAVATLGFWLCLPLLTSLEAPNRWWAPATFSLLALTCLGTGMLMSRPSAERPAPSTLVYAYEHGAESAVWATSPRAISGGGSANGAASGATGGALAAIDDPGVAWAVERVGEGFDELRTLDDFGYGSGALPVASARVLAVEPPAVDVVGDTLFADARRVVLRVRSRIGAERLAFQLEGETRLTAINGQPISNVEELRWIDHWGVPDGDGVVLELTMPPESPIDVHVIEELLRPEELLGRDAFRRPPELAPNTVRRSDRALFRYSVAAFADPRYAPAPSESAERDLVTPPPNTGMPIDSVEIRRDTLPTNPPDTGGVVDTLGAAVDTGTALDPPDTAAVDTTAGTATTGTVDTTGRAAAATPIGDVPPPNVEALRRRSR